MIKDFANSKLEHTGFDPHSGSAYETVLTRDDFNNATQEITTWQGYEATPLHELKALADALEIDSIYYKDEGSRFNLGSFKALGGAYAGLKLVQRELSKRLDLKISTADIRAGKYKDDVAKITLVSATDGNHGRSLSWGAKMFGAPCKIYIHSEVSEGRAQSMRDLGADVIRIDGDYDASVDSARIDAEKNDWFVVSDTSWEGYTQPPVDVMAGYGVMTNEIVSQISVPPTHVFLQGGVGGLAAGVIASLRQHWEENSPRVIIVESELAACLYKSALADEIQTFEIEEETLMAGLSCGEPSELAWQILRENAQDFITMPEEIVAPAMRLLARPLGDDPKIVAGESAIAGLATLVSAASQKSMREALSLSARSRVLLIGSEGATDPEIYRQIMAG